MPARKPRCAHHGCMNECLQLWIVAPIVIFGVTLALFLPFLSSIGVKITSKILANWNFTWLTAFIIMAWFASVLIGCLRRHENEYVCFVDAIGLPGLVTGLFYAIKGLA